MFGRDILNKFDADGLFTDGEGLDIVRQDALHRILTDDILAPWL